MLQKKKFRVQTKKKVLMIVFSELLIGSIGLGVKCRLTVSGLAPVWIMCAGVIPFLSSISTMITIEHFPKIKIRYTKLRALFEVITLLYEKKLK